MGGQMTLGMGARKAFVFHNGRGSQAGIFAEFKSDNALGYVRTRICAGNQIYRSTCSRCSSPTTSAASYG
jgi:hypothetical protein